MGRRIILLVFSVLALLVLAACSSSTSPEGGGGSVQIANDWSPKMVIFDLFTADFRDPETVARFAKADILILNACNVYGKGFAKGSVAQLKAANPDLIVLLFTGARRAPTYGPTERDTQPFVYDWVEATRPYWCWTTTGDTLIEWPGEVTIDISYPECRRAMVEIISRYQNSGDNPVDGLFWDYFNPHLYIAPQAERLMTGEPDLDGDGINHYEDEDELETFRASQYALVQEINAALGDDFIQVFNGRLAQVDSNFAALGDGFQYERFPQMYGTDRDMERALDPSFPFNLFASRGWPRKRNGGPFMILANKYQVSFLDHNAERYYLNLADINRVVALMTDCAVVYTPQADWAYGWPTVELKLGRALGGPVRDGAVMTRRFQRGTVQLTFTTGAHPIPFDFEIVQDGQVVQALAVPYHYP